MNGLSELIRLLRGAWGFAVLLCRFFFVCGVAVNKIPRCGVAVISNRTVCGVLILKLRCSVPKIPSRCCSLLFDTFDRLTRTLVGLVELSKPIYIRQTVLCNFLGKKALPNLSNLYQGHQAVTQGAEELFVMKRKFHCRTNESPLFAVETIMNLTLQHTIVLTW